MIGLNAFLRIEQKAGKKYHEGMKRDFLTCYEASKKYKLSQSYLRTLLAKGEIIGDQIPVSASRKIWLINKDSLLAFLASDRKVGRPKSTQQSEKCSIVCGGVSPEYRPGKSSSKSLSPSEKKDSHQQ